MVIHNSFLFRCAPFTGHMVWKKAVRGKIMSTELVFSAVALIGLAALVPCIMVATTVFGPRSKGKIKNEAYESGVGPIIGTVDQKFSVKFYLLAILFLIFDIEAVFMYPWAVIVRELGWFGFIEMVVFMLFLLTGLIYILKKGVLNWR
jgi:NADH-quinone oxidoreductase subunit A